MFYAEDYLSTCLDFDTSKWDEATVRRMYVSLARSKEAMGARLRNDIDALQRELAERRRKEAGHEAEVMALQRRVRGTEAVVVQCKAQIEEWTAILRQAEVSNHVPMQVFDLDHLQNVVLRQDQPAVYGRGAEQRGGRRPSHRPPPATPLFQKREYYTPVHHPKEAEAVIPCPPELERQSRVPQSQRSEGNLPPPQAWSASRSLERFTNNTWTPGALVPQIDTPVRTGPKPPPHYDHLLFRLDDGLPPPRDPEEPASLFEVMRDRVNLLDRDGGTWDPATRRVIGIRLVPVWSVHAPDPEGNTLTLHTEKLKLLRVGGGYEKIVEAGSLDTVVTEDGAASPAPTPGLVLTLTRERLLGEIEYLSEQLAHRHHLEAKFNAEVASELFLLRCARAVLRDAEEHRVRFQELGLGGREYWEAAEDLRPHGPTEPEVWDYAVKCMGLMVQDSVEQRRFVEQREREIARMQREVEQVTLNRLNSKAVGVQTDPDEVVLSLAEEILFDVLDEFMLGIVRDAINDVRRDTVEEMLGAKYVPRRIKPHLSPGFSVGSHAVRIRDHPTVLRAIERVYEAKQASDAQSDRDGLARVSLAAHVMDYLSNLFGLQGLIDAGLLDLFASCNAYKRHCPCVKTFVRHLEDYPPELLNFHLFCQRLASRAGPAGPAGTYRVESSGVVLCSRTCSVLTLRAALEGLPAEVLAHSEERLLSGATGVMWGSPPDSYVAAHPSIVTNGPCAELHAVLNHLLDEWIAEESRRDEELNAIFDDATAPANGGETEGTSAPGDAGDKDVMNMLVPYRGFITAAATAFGPGTSREALFLMFEEAVEDTRGRGLLQTGAEMAADRYAFVSVCKAHGALNRWAQGESHRFIHRSHASFSALVPRDLKGRRIAAFKEGVLTAIPQGSLQRPGSPAEVLPPNARSKGQRARSPRSPRSPRTPGSSIR